MTQADERLRITEIFFSLQGETSRVGLPTTFIRLTGCPLRCAWCDTAYAFGGGEWKTIDAILDATRRFPTRYVTVTGGEPLAQRGCLGLLTALCNAGFDVSLETSGALDVSRVDGRVSRIVDLKAPASGESARNLWSNLALLRARDEIKIVVADRADYEWARQTFRERGLDQICPVLLAPVAGSIEPRTLAEWILEDGLPVRMQLQLHKLLWQDARGR